MANGGLAKLKLVMEIEGDKVVVSGLERYDDAVERSGRTTKTATERMASGMGNVETATGRMAATHGQAMNQMSATTRMNHNTMTAFEKQIQSITMRIWNLTMAAGMIAAPFAAAGAAILFGINAIDDFQMSATQIAAQLTQLQGPKDVAKHYQESVVYATALATKLEEVDEKSSINSKGLTAMTQVMTTQGMVLDINNKKQVTAFTDLSNAIAMVTKGQDQQMQAYQEMRSLTTGQIDHNSQLSRMLDSQIKQQGIYKGGLKDVVELGRQHGDLLERLQPYLVGINAASGDISKSWSTATSSLETAINKVVRIGFKDVFADTVPLVIQISSYLKEHADQIGGYIQEGWHITKFLIDGSASGLKVMGVVMQTTVLPTLQDIYNVAHGTSEAITAIPGLLVQSPGLITAIGVAAYYAVGGIGAMALAWTGLSTVIVASMTTNPLGWAALGIGAVYLAAKPAVTALDALMHKYLDLNVTGEAMYNEEMKRAAAADKAWSDAKAKALWMYKEGGIPLSPGMKAELGPQAPVIAPPKPPADTDTIASYNSFVTAFNSKISAVEEANPLLSQHEKELLKIADAQAAMIVQYPKQAGEINKLYAWIKQETVAYQEQATAIKKTSDEFKYLLSVWESDTLTPQHNDAGQFNITNEEIIKLIDTLNGQTAIDEYNEKLRKLNGLMSESPERAAEISSAISVLNANFKASQLGPTLANISNQLTLVDHAEKTYAVNTVQASQRRIPLLQQEVAEQQKIYDSIKGNEPAAQALRQQTLDKITATNGRLQDQQKLLYDTTALGGMTNALLDYRKEAENVGAQVKNLVTNIYKGGEDALVSLMATGRVNLKSLIDGMKSDLLHMAAKRIMLSILPDFSAEVGAATTSAAILANGGAMAGSAMIAGAEVAAGILAAGGAQAGTGAAVGGTVGVAGGGGMSAFISAAMPFVAVIAAAVVATNYFKSDSWNNKTGSQKGWAIAAGVMTGGLANMVDWATGGGLFGTNWKAVRGGVSLGIDNGDASGQSYVDSEKKKSWFRGTSRKTEYGALSDQWEQFIDMQFGAVKDSIRNRSTALGITISEEALAGFSSAATKINLSGLSGEDQQKAISDYFRKISNEAITLLVPDIEQMTRLGEDATAAYERMNALKLTNNSLLMAEMEILGSKGTTEYMKLLNVQRESELLKMEDSTQVIQRRIYALQDEAVATEKAAAALAYTADLTTRLLTATGQDKLSGLLALQVKQEKELADARKNGMDTAMLVQVQQLEMANAMKTASETISEATQKIIATAKTALTDAVSLNTTILGTMKELLSGATAQLSPEAAYNQAKAQFATADASNISDRVTAFMTASQNYNGSGQTYQTDRLAALDKLSQFAETAPTLSNVERQIQLLGEIKSAVETGDFALIAATQITYNAAQIDMGTAKNCLTMALEGIQSALNTPISAGTASGAITGQIFALQSSINMGIMDGTAKTAITAQISGLQNTFNSPVYDGTAKASMASQIAALQATINTTVMDGTTKGALLSQIAAFNAATSSYVSDGTAKAAITGQISALQATLNTGVTGSAKDAVSNSIGALQLALNGTVSAATAQAAISTAYSVVQGALNGTISGTVAANSLATQYSITQAALNGTISSAAATQALQTVYGTVQGALNGTISSTTATQAIGTVYATVQGALNGTVTGSAAASAIGSTYSTIQGALNGTISGATAATTIAGQYGSVTSALDSGLNVGTNSISSLLSTFNDSLTASAKTTRDGLLNFTNALAIVSDYTRQRTDAQAALGSLSSQYRAGTITGDQYTTQAATALAPLNSTIAAGSSLGLTSLSAPTSGITSEDIDVRMQAKAAGTIMDILKTSPTYAAHPELDIATSTNRSDPNSPLIYTPNGTLGYDDTRAWQNIASGAIKWSSLGLPAFVAGGDHLGGFRIVGENGPELEATGPSRIFNANQTRDIFRNGSADNKELVAAIDKLEKRLEKIERNTEAGNRVAQAVGQETIAIGKRQERNLENIANTARVAA